jgi:hypothetical protein
MRLSSNKDKIQGFFAALRMTNSTPRGRQLWYDTTCGAIKL